MASFTGSSGDDLIDGTLDADFTSGGAGSDSLQPGNGDDVYLIAGKAVVFHGAINDFAFTNDLFVNDCKCRAY